MALSQTSLLLSNYSLMTHNFLLILIPPALASGTVFFIACTLSFVHTRDLLCARSPCFVLLGFALNTEQSTLGSSFDASNYIVDNDKDQSHLAV